ncbi:signal transduction histidine kinase [Sagittula marina]|uniref:histidine kinase n=1 Tax=Sagittula marina TaxID=943940 RepID=A0A7W6DS50_9RHOB|nr:HAMP domain-containing sensor histidine kinase [Sagittula marina]MBB3985902.1 signal transduction histidine kinase [Sagittula marina]
MKDVETDQQDFESYLYIITHDLKTYSRAMRVIPEWIEEDLHGAGMTLPEEVVTHMSMLKSYAQGMDRMLDGLTDLSRVGRLSDPHSAISLCSAIGAAWARMSDNVGFDLDLSGVVGTVQAPQNDLDRLIEALLSNAIIHHGTRSGKIRVSGREDGHRVMLRVLDDGPGIDEGYEEKIFQPLYTLRPKDEVGTAGMGLAIARKVVTLLGGHIGVLESPAGWGCCIECDLPRAGV